jgi:hypothetical protein
LSPRRCERRIQKIETMTPHPYITRRARGLAPLNRPRPRSRGVSLARIAAAVLVLAWLASLAALAWWVLIP